MSEKWKVKKADGSVYSPADTDAMRKWIQEYRVLKDDLISPEDKENWREVKSLPEFSDLFGIKTPLKKERNAKKEKSLLESGGNYCPNCDKKIDKDTKFCPFCGNFIDTLRKKKEDKTIPAKSKDRISKAKIIIGIIIILIVTILVANWCVSMIAERKLDRRISQLPRETLLPFAITYSNISVNALLGRVSFNNITVSDTYKTVKFGCDTVRLNLTHSNIIDLIKESEFDDINFCAIAFNNLKLKLLGGDIRFGKLGIKFDGHINREIIKNGLREFPDEHQKLKVFLKGAKLQFPKVYQELALSPALQKRISQIDRLSLKIAYDPNSQKISGEFRISAPLLSFNSTGFLRYTGNSPKDFKPEKGSFKLLLKIVPTGLQWGRSNVTGRYSMGKILMKSTLDYKYSPQLDYILPTKGNLNFLAKDLNAEFSGSLKQELEGSEFGQIMGMDMNKLNLDKLSIQCKYARNQLKVFDTGLSTPFLKAVFNAQTKIDEDNIEESVIKYAKLIITPLTKNMETALLKFEDKIGLSFLHRRKAIVLEVRDATLKKEAARFCYKLAASLMEEGFEELALQYAEKSIDLSSACDEEVASIYSTAAREFLKNGKTRKAKAYFEKAVSLNRKTGKEVGQFYFELGKNFLRELDIEETFEAFDTALQHNPKLRELIGEAFVECSNPKETFSKAIRKYGNTEAMEYLDKFVLVNQKIKKNTAKIIYEIAGEYLDEGDEETALFWARKASEWTTLYQKGIAKMYRDLGIKYYNQKTESRYRDGRNKEKAREFLGKAIEIDKMLESDENVYFIYYIETPPDGPDLKTCKGFLEKFPNSNRLDCVLGKMAEVMKKKP